MGLKVSIIVATFNGADKISNLLKGLLLQWRDEFELIIVIDGSTDNTKEVVKGFESVFPIMKLIVQENQGRAVARNRGIREAMGDILVCYDDDMTPSDNSVLKHIQFHENYRGIVCGQALELQDSAKSDIQNYKAHLTQKWVRNYPDQIALLTPDNYFFTAANSSFARESFDLLGGFDERLSDAEDFDFGFRAQSLGLGVYFDKTNKAIHNDLITCVSYIRRLRLYAEAHKELKNLYPERRMRELRKSFLDLPKRMIYNFFASAFWVRIIDSRVLLYFLFRRIRYRLYDVVIESLAVRHPNVKL